MQRRILKGEKTKAFALERATRDDWIEHYALRGYGIDDIQVKLSMKHNQRVPREVIKHIVLRGRHGPA